VVYDFASGADSACSGTGISTLLITTGFVLGTLRADYALGSASRRAADVARYARAHALTVDLSALTVGTAWGRIAGVRYNGS
jgi:hypothetical protein